MKKKRAKTRARAKKANAGSPQAKPLEDCHRANPLDRDAHPKGIAEQYCGDDDEPEVGFGFGFGLRLDESAEQPVQTIEELSKQTMDSRPCVGEVDEESFVEGVQCGEMWPGVLSSFHDCTTVMPSFTKALHWVAQLAKDPRFHQPNVSGTRQVIFYYGAMSCTALCNKNEIVIEIHKIATLKGERNSVGIECHKALDELVNNETEDGCPGFGAATITIVSILNEKWRTFLLGEGWAAVAGSKHDVFISKRRGATTPTSTAK